MPKKTKRSLEDKLVEVKLDEALIQNNRFINWTKFRSQYSDLIFSEKRNSFIFGFLAGAFLMFIFLMSIASI
jgi:hypothetical protein